MTLRASSEITTKGRYFANNNTAVCPSVKFTRNKDPEN